MSYAIGRSLRPIWRWTSYRPPPHFSMRRDGILGLHASAAFYTQRRSDEMVMFLKRYGRQEMVKYLKRYGRQGVSAWMNRKLTTSPEQSGLRHLAPTEEPPSPWNIANAITAGRIAVTPLIGYWIICGQYNLALSGLLYAGASDALDGILARRLNLRTVLGSYLDPAADKLLISTTSVCLAFNGVIPPGLVALMIGRDVGLIGGWLWLTHDRTDMKKRSRFLPLTHLEPLFISKLNTSLQIALGFAGVLHAADWGVVSEEALQKIGYATALTTTASGVSYANKFWKIHVAQ